MTRSPLARACSLRATSCPASWWARRSARTSGCQTHPRPRLPRRVPRSCATSRRPTSSWARPTIAGASWAPRAPGWSAPICMQAQAGASQRRTLSLAGMTSCARTAACWPRPSRSPTPVWPGWARATRRWALPLSSMCSSSRRTAVACLRSRHSPARTTTALPSCPSRSACPRRALPGVSSIRTPSCRPTARAAPSAARRSLPSRRTAWPSGLPTRTRAARSWASRAALTPRLPCSCARGRLTCWDLTARASSPSRCPALARPCARMTTPVP